MTILLCFVLHQIVRKTDFVQFYITLCQERNRITLEPTEDVGLVRNHVVSYLNPIGKLSKLFEYYDISKYFEGEIQFW